MIPQPVPKKKIPDELLREAVNAKGVEIVEQGFQAIDELAEAGKRRLKKAILEILTSRNGRQPK